MPDLHSLQQLLELLERELALPTGRRPSGTTDEGLRGAIRDARRATLALREGHDDDAQHIIATAPRRTLEAWSNVTMRFVQPDDDPRLGNG